MNLTELRTTAIQKLETETLTAQSRQREEAILETVIELEKLTRELGYLDAENAKLKQDLASATFDLENYVETTVYLNAEIAVKDMAIADRNAEVADLYLWIEEAETFMYEQSRRKVREGERE